MLTESELTDNLDAGDEPADELALYGAASVLTTDGAEEVIAGFRQSIIEGQHWYLALLEAVRQWRWPEEVVDGRVYRYLIGGEAFDWLVLAERLCEAAADLLPEQEVVNLLFHGRPPLELDPAEFKRRIGPDKYRAYLNYYYGVTVEEALQLAVALEAEKERLSCCYPDPHRLGTVHERIYNATEAELLSRFQSERGLPHNHSISFIDYKEFIYWLFKYRLRRCDPARVASDTKKALRELYRYHALKGFVASRPQNGEQEDRTNL